MQASQGLVPSASEPGAPPRIDYRRVSLISAGHMTNDMYGNLLTSLMPYLVLDGRISASLAGFILLVYLAGSSVLQPIFGLFADRSGLRLFAVAGPIWVGVAASLVGWAPSVGALFALAAIAGVGTAAFHPQAASMVNALSPLRKAWSMSLFSMGGNIGFAIGPVLAAGMALVGLKWTPLALIPGLLLLIPLARFAPHPHMSASLPEGGSLRRHAIARWRPLSLIVTVIATRSATQYALIIFLPLYYHARGLPAELGSLYAFVLSLTGALGGLLGGYLADRYGRQIVVVSSLVVTAPLLLAALLSSGVVVWPLLALSGAALLASNSVTVVQGQELLPRHTGVASGLTLGLGFGLSGVMASSLTIATDHLGITQTTLLIPALPLLAAALAALIPLSTRFGHAPAY